MRHPLDRPVGSDLSYKVLQHRNSPEQLKAAQFDNTLGTLKVVSGYNPRLFIADPDMDDPGDGVNPRARK